MLALALACSGCATHALWTETSQLNAGNSPADLPKLQLFEARRQNDLLVVYNEYSERHDRIRRRAYFLNRNQLRIEQRHEPEFVSPRHSRGLSEVPVFFGTNPPKLKTLPSELYVLAETNSPFFTVYCKGARSERCMLPVYDDHLGTAIRICLTPVTVVADATIIGGYVFVYAWAEGGAQWIH